MIIDWQQIVNLLITAGTAGGQAGAGGNGQIKITWS